MDNVNAIFDSYLKNSILEGDEEFNGLIFFNVSDPDFESWFVEIKEKYDDKTREFVPKDESKYKNIGIYDYDMPKDALGVKIIKLKNGRNLFFLPVKLPEICHPLWLRREEPFAVFVIEYDKLQVEIINKSMLFKTYEIAKNKFIYGASIKPTKG